MKIDSFHHEPLRIDGKLFLRSDLWCTDTKGVKRRFTTGTPLKSPCVSPQLIEEVEIEMRAGLNRVIDQMQNTMGYC